MSATITGTQTVAVTLTSSSTAYLNPVAISGALDIAAGTALVVESPWSVDNHGTIAAAAGLGLSLSATATIDNTGTILAPGSIDDGVRANNGRTTLADISLTNDGLISGGSMGVRLVAISDSLQNQAAGTIIGGAVGADLNGAPGMTALTNDGVIRSDGGTGVLLYSADAVNAAGGTILGGSVGVSLGAAADFTNAGTVIGGKGIEVSNTNTLIDSGLIEGTSGIAVSFSPIAVAMGAPAAGGSMTILPGASIDGTLEGNGVASLFFAGSSPATFDNFTSVVSGFQTVAVEAGSAWDLAGQGALSGSGSLVNDGTIIVSGTDNLGVYASVSGSAGTFDLEGGSLTLGNFVGDGEVIHFGNSESSSLVIGQHAGGFFGTIDGFRSNDFLEIGGFGSSVQETSTFANDTLTLNGSAGPITLAFQNAPASLAIEPVTVLGTKSYEVVVPCFAAGTRLLTDAGYRDVETLREGDRLITRGGTARPIVWHGWRRVDCRRHPRPEAVRPVRIVAGAFGPGVPMRDLVLSPDHAVFWAGVLIPVQFLLNGVSVRQEPVASVTYHHVELDTHDLVWADNLVTESYLDCGNRHHFAEQGSVEALHADFTPLAWDETRACAPLAIDGPAVAAARRILHAGLRREGYEVARVDLRIEADSGRPGKSILIRAGSRRARHRRVQIDLPEASHRVSFRSKTSCPAEIDPGATDRRRLGAAIANLTLDDMPVAFDDPRVLSGFHDAEAGPRGEFAWTDGHGLLSVEGARSLSFDLQGQAAIWRRDGGHGSAEAGARRKIAGCRD